MPAEPSAAYGTTRERGANLSHGEIERAALELLSRGQRPSVALLRGHLNRGSPATIASSLKRFWRDLGARMQGDAAALARVPSDVADLSDQLWQRALTLAAQSARRDDNAARERLDRIRIENELRAQSFALREREFETAARERKRALADSRAHLLSTLRMLEADRVTLRARDKRIADLQAQIEDYRRELATVVARAVTKNNPLPRRKFPAPTQLKSKLPARRRASLKGRRREAASKDRSNK